jgi:hypothetical protein
VFKIPSRYEVFFCYPDTSSEYCNRALVWNWSTNSLTYRSLPSVTCGAICQYEGSAAVGETWDTDSEAWDADTSGWDARLFNATAFQPLMGSSDLNLYWFGVSDTWPEVTYEWVAERQSLPITGGVEGRPFIDTSIVKFIREVWPRITLPSGETATLEIGTQMSWSAPITWQPAKVFNPTVSPKCNYMVTGRLLSVRFQGTSRASTKLLGFDLDLEQISKY